MAISTSSQSRPRRHIRESRVDQIFNVTNYTLLTLYMLLILYPLVYILSASFSDGAAVISGRVILWPVDFSLEAYKKILAYQ